MFGFKITRTNGTATPAITETETDQELGKTQAEIFARKHARGAAQAMLNTIGEIGRNSSRIVKIALGVSMPHQVAFIYSLISTWMHWDSFAGVVESLSLIGLSIGIPVGVDLLILNCIKIIGTAAASDASKKLAMWIITIPVLASMAVNFLAPGPVLVKILAAFIVSVIPMAEALRAFTKPDFAKLEKMEMDIVSKLQSAVEADAATEQTPTIDHKALNKERQIKAEQARELAARIPDITVKALMGATGCGQGAARKAIEQAKQTTPAPEMAV